MYMIYSMVLTYHSVVAKGGTLMQVQWGALLGLGTLALENLSALSNTARCQVMA